MSSDTDKAVADLADKDANVRWEAVQALGNSPEAVAEHGAAIVQLLEDGDADVRAGVNTNWASIGQKWPSQNHVRVRVSARHVGEPSQAGAKGVDHTRAPSSSDPARGGAAEATELALVW